MLTALLLSLATSPQEPVGDTIACGPFLLQPGPHTITIVIDDETATPASLRFWSDEHAEQRIAHEESARHHVFTLEGLEPDTEYTYAVQAGSQNSGPHTFRTLPVRPERYRILAVGDVRTHPKDWAAVSGRMEADELGALFAVGKGDYPSDGRKYEQWVEQFFEPARGFLARMPLWPAIGNHEATRAHDDVTKVERSHYFSLFELPGNERWYRVDYHLMTLLVLDSNSSLEPHKAQYQWLREQLRSARNRFTLIALHHAPLTSGPHGKQHPDGTPREWPVDQGRRFLVPLFEMYDVDLVLCGHDHLYERSEKDGVMYIVTGGGGAPLYRVNSVNNRFQRAALAVHHYTALDVDATGIDLTAIAKSGAIIDRARIPTGQQHLARRTHSVTEALKRAVVVDELDTDSMEARVLLSNPLDHPLTVSLRSAGEGHPVTPQRVTLDPAEEREVGLGVVDVGGQLAAEPWRAAIALDLSLGFDGQDQALELDLELPHRATVYRPRYATPRLEGVRLDGELSEWQAVTAIQFDERTPVVKNRDHYGGEEDITAELRFAWSADGLHLAAQVHDDQVLVDETTSLDEADGLRLLLEAPGRSKGLSVLTFGASGRTDTEGVQHIVTRTADGWILEARLPLEVLGLDAGAAPTSLSCDVLLIDRDVEGEQQTSSYQRLWTESSSRSDRSTFGVLEPEE